MIGGLYFGSAPFAGSSGIPSLLQATAGAITFAASAALTATANLAAAGSIVLSSVAAFAGVPLTATAGAITFSSAPAELTTPTRFGAAISIGNIDATRRVRIAGLTIRDVLNDAPSTAGFVVEGERPAVGQPVRITIGTPPVLLFAGSVQTIEQAYESLPQFLAWQIQAIDDTDRANRRRPLGTFIEISATTIANTIATQFAPAFSTAGVEANLPAVTIVFDGADTFIACLARLATAIGGYAKIEDGTIYLLTTDYAAPPDPIDLAHPPLNSPPISVSTDSSQLRTRVYGKGYGENIQADIGAGETLVPIQDGVMFPPLGGTLIAAVTPEGAQSEKITYSSIELRKGGSLVGPGSSPGNPPGLALQPSGTPGITDGAHEWAYVFVTATGKTLPSPRAPLTVGYLAGPPSALTVGAPLPGTGPDEGWHDYGVTFVTAYGETLGGPISNPMQTSAAVGQLTPPSACSAGSAMVGNGADEGTHHYVVTFVNAEGETQAGTVSNGTGTGYAGNFAPPGAPTPGTPIQGAGVPNGNYAYGVTFVNTYGETTVGGWSGMVTAQSQIVGATSPVPPPGAPFVAGGVYTGALTGAASYCYRVTYTTAAGESLTGNLGSRQLNLTGLAPPAITTTGTTGGALTPSTTYYYVRTWTTAQGESLPSASSSEVLSASENAITISAPSTSESRVTGSKVYRKTGTGGIYRLVATFSGAGAWSQKDTASDASIAAAAQPPIVDATVENGFNLTLSTSADPRVTGRKIYRDQASGTALKLLTTIANNTQTTYQDLASNASIVNNAPPPTVDSTASAGTSQPFNQIPLTNIAIGPAGTTARRIYRVIWGQGIGNLVAEISNNNITTHTDSLNTPGAQQPATNTTGTMYAQIPLSNIPIGAAGTTQRKIYRRFNGAGTFKHVVTLGNNTTTIYTDTDSNAQLGAEVPTSNTTGTAQQKLPLSNIPIGPGGVTARNIYRRFNGAGAFRLAHTLSNNTATTYTDTAPNSALGVNAPASSSAYSNRVNVTWPAAPTATTSIELYRTAVGSSQLKRWYIHGANTAGTVLDTTADASLGINAPTDDTSGLQQPQGQVNPGALVLPVASATPFRVGGGWVELGGGQVVRYTGTSGSTLVGIPASGPGAITTTVLYGSQAMPSPLLVGVVGISRTLLKGAQVAIWVQRDDLAAQTEHAARTGGDGIVEYLITDSRRGIESLTARCDADLALFSRPIETVRYATRDLKTKSGKPVHITLPSQGIAVTFLTIQDVTISEIDAAPGLAPRFTVTASTVRFSLEDLLRRTFAAENKLR